MSLRIDDIMQKETRNKVVCLLLAVCSVAAIGINFENIPEMKGLYAVLASLHGWGLGQAVLVLCLACLYHYIRRSFPVQKDIAVFSLLLSGFVLLGLCYKNATGIALCMLNAAQVMKTMLVLIGYGTMIYCLVLILYQWMINLTKRHVGSRQAVGSANDKYKLKTGIFLFVCWLPYLISFYPGSALYDAGTMLEQWYGYEPLTNHHPYFQILFLVFFVKIGEDGGRLVHCPKANHFEREKGLTDGKKNWNCIERYTMPDHQTRRRFGEDCCGQCDGRGQCGRV